MVVRCLSTLDLHRVRVSLSLEFLQPLVTRIVSSSRVSRIETPLFFARCVRLDARFVRERKDAGKTVERFLENHAPSYFHRGKKVNRTNDRKRRRWSNAFPPSLRTPVHSFSSSSLPLAKEEKKKKDLDRRKSKWKREREKEGETKGSVNGTVGKMAGRVYNSTRTDGRWFVLSSGRTVGCRQKNYYA